MRILLSVLLGLSVLAVVVGCGGGPKTTTVAGTVTFNGQSVDDGTVVFEPAEGKKAVTVAVVKGGQYSQPVPPGSYKIKVYWPKVPTPGSTNPYKEAGERIPEKFNQKTNLTLDVGSDTLQKNWELKD
jgi:hypothetical protein